MNLISTKNEKATVCAKDTCVTVYGDTARIVNVLVLFAVFVTAVALIDKALK